MTSSYWNAIVAQWAAQGPMWCVLLGGIIAASIFWNRCPGPAMLAMLAALLSGLVAAVHPVAFMWLTEARITHAWNMKEFGVYSMASTVIFNALQAAGYARRQTAAVVGRHPAQTVPPPLPTDPRSL